MKVISTDGDVNTVADLIPKALPVFYVLAPEYIRLLLEPVMEFSLTWPADFAVHDIGKSMMSPDYPQLHANTEIDYPNATGETLEAEEALLLDQTSVLLWMAYSYQKLSGNTEWVRPYLPTQQNTPTI